MIRYVSSCFLAVNTSVSSAHFTTDCIPSQGPGSNSTKHIIFQLHCCVGAVYELFWSINLHYHVIWVCEPNISAVCPLSSSIFCFCILSWLAVQSTPSGLTKLTSVALQPASAGVWAGPGQRWCSHVLCWTFISTKQDACLYWVFNKAICLSLLCWTLDTLAMFCCISIAVQLRTGSPDFKLHGIYLV